MKVSRHCRRWRDCPLCLRGVDSNGHLEHYCELYRRARKREDDERMGLKKPTDVEVAGAVPQRARSGDDWILYPTLMEFLTEDRWEDGSPRRTATITLFADAGAVKASLNDRHFDRVAFVTSESIAALLVVLEDKLKASSLDFRPSQGGGRGKTKK